MAREQEPRRPMGAYDIGLDDKPKYNQGVLDHDIKPGCDVKNETRTICDRWAYPTSVTRPILVLAMNEYLDTGTAFIPGEIALTPFTLGNGIDLKNTYCAQVDPGDNLPQEYHKEANMNAEKFGLRKVSSSFPGHVNRDYKKIADEIEAFIKANSEPVANPEEDNDGGNGDAFIIFCKKESVYSYAGGLNWLYEIAGKGEFPHKLLPFESILVVLSHSGLKTLADGNRLEKQNHHIIMGLLIKTVASANDYINGKNLLYDNRRPYQLDRIRDMLAVKFLGAIVVHPDIEAYTTIRGIRERFASRHFEEYPHPFFGAFMCEEQVASYLDLSAYSQSVTLPCTWHRDENYFADGPIIRRVIEEDSPWHQRDNCARMRLARMIYLALDVIIINFPIQPVNGKHFPE